MVVPFLGLPFKILKYPWSSQKGTTLVPSSLPNCLRLCFPLLVGGLGFGASGAEPRAYSPGSVSLLWGARGLDLPEVCRLVAVLGLGIQVLAAGVQVFGIYGLSGHVPLLSSPLSSLLAATSAELAHSSS